MVYNWYCAQVLLKGPRSLISSNILLVYDLYIMLWKGPHSHGKKFTSLLLVLYMFNYFNYLSAILVRTDSD
jgi:hypothetical protein